MNTSSPGGHPAQSQADTLLEIVDLFEAIKALSLRSFDCTGLAALGARLAREQFAVIHEASNGSAS